MEEITGIGVSGDKKEVTRQHELIYELSIEQVMARDIIFLYPDNTLWEAKELFRVNRISGAPVLEDGKLVGIVSVEDIILALERNEIDLPVRERMTTDVVSVRSDESVVQAVNLFAKLRVGRLPVVDNYGRVVGIITRGNIVRGLLKAMDVDYRTEEELAHQRIRHVFHDLVSDNTSVTLRYTIPSHDLTKGGSASSRIKRALGRLGIDPKVIRRAAIAAYEAEMNIIIHAEDGGELVVELRPHLINIEAIDRGPGIANLEQALQAGFSTAPDWVRELGFGAGMGLTNIKNCADGFHIDTTPGRGTHLYISILLEKQ